ncbi:LysR substrate-binding domain-containing protein [Mycobacterium sp. 21AC1]|nr:LysR substrate-binding domain-containing protein [Mycobacterium sp. 21AC1]
MAQALHFVPSGISQQLAQLESDVGVRLLERVGRNVRLTTEAKVLVEHTKKVLSQLDQAESDLAAAAHEPVGTIRVGAFQTAAESIVPGALVALREHERLRVEVIEAKPSTALPALLDRDLQLLVTEQFPGYPFAVPSEIIRFPVVEDPLYLARSNGRASPDLAEARHDAWVMEPEGSVGRRWAIAQCRDAGFEPDIRFEAANLSIHVQLVHAGHASSFLPDLLWRTHERPPGLYELVGERRSISIALRAANETHPAIKAVCRAIQRAAAAIPMNDREPAAKTLG